MHLAKPRCGRADFNTEVTEFTESQKGARGGTCWDKEKVS